MDTDDVGIVKVGRELSETFELVKDVVRRREGRQRAGLMLGLQELGASLSGFIGAYYPVYSNIIVVNKTPLRRIAETEPQLFTPYTFHLLLHEYIHSLGLFDEELTRRKPYGMRDREKIVVERKPVRFKTPQTPPAHLSGLMLLAKVYSLDDAKEAMKAGADRAYYNIFAKDFPFGEERISPYVPRCLAEWNARQALGLIEQARPKSVLAGDLGAASMVRNCEVYLDVSCNAFNDVDVSYYNGLGMTPIISPELSLKELDEFSDRRFVAYVHGRLPLMTTKYTLEETTLADEMGYAFPARGELDQKQIQNSVPLGLFDGVKRLERQGVVRYLLDMEEDVAGTVETYRRILSGERIKKPKGGYTLGHYMRGVT